MANELAIAKENRLAMPAPEYSNEQIRILAETVAKGCDQNELGFFLNVCKLKRLDPFSGQVHCIKRWDSQLGREKMVVQVGIDGFRVNAARTEELAGSDDPVYDTEDGEHPNWAKVTVYRYGRNDERVPYTATARWGEYVQKKKDGTPAGKWVQMPFLMLGKCAEALALRKAFPDELSGMYTNEEMEQADSEGVAPASVTSGKPPVSMPKSTDETKAKAEPVKAETVQQNAPAQSADKISGEITRAEPGTGPTEGSLFLIVDKKIVQIPKELVDAEMVKGAKLLAKVTKKPSKKGDVYVATAVEMVVPPVQEGEIINAEVVEEKSDPAQAAAHSAAMDAVAEDIFGDEKKPEAKAAETEATKPGTAGVKRAQRLHTLITQNHKNTGFTEEHLKRYLATQRIEHARDLSCPPKGSEAFNAYEYACGMAVGEIDWHEILED